MSEGRLQLHTAVSNKKNEEYVGGFNHRYALYVCLPTQI
ncbi:hypothetical protein BN890_25960 [Bacteroides xylanisolvens SD CC 1b]|uniref:Uncharacterized protein n=1 Tax=Bacteroides xylanisolvens SD CC 1b TaxID=702447 RepID=D4VGK8_9BACE|nr:hypothetical protein CW3_4801 [Bacteroides xylanisolvens SD CC 1b]CDM05010.1 hypothetical protein BN890_25960 [Bacteroides xylanisolvens SD CC 1b]